MCAFLKLLSVKDAQRPSQHHSPCVLLWWIYPTWYQVMRWQPGQVTLYL